MLCGVCGLVVDCWLVCCCLWLGADWCLCVARCLFVVWWLVVDVWWLLEDGCRLLLCGGCRLLLVVYCGLIDSY